MQKLYFVKWPLVPIRNLWKRRDAEILSDDWRVEPGKSRKETALLPCPTRNGSPASEAVA